ncbi:hypothetical protein IFM89_032832 [Coptis chinensis]|uniref:NADP-dependent oxidoreductase domain-containing protein n=1 Tax=Coptis chinensis TaxID=261450 RepID=A0A835LPT0_9MAGN|nr:hypothetical protein IFM89_032832 [Coptis chinensis]
MATRKRNSVWFRVRSIYIAACAPTSPVFISSILVCYVQIGTALKQLFSTGVVKRQDLFITSKLWFVSIHWPVRTKPGTRGFSPDILHPNLCLEDTWHAMEGLYASGQARAIGVSNYSTKKLQDLLNYAKVPPAVNQVECHPVWQQTSLKNLCKSTGVHLSAYSPLGSPAIPGSPNLIKQNPSSLNTELLKHRTTTPIYDLSTTKWSPNLTKRNPSSLNTELLKHRTTGPVYDLSTTRVCPCPPARMNWPRLWHHFRASDRGLMYPNVSSIKTLLNSFISFQNFGDT